MNKNSKGKSIIIQYQPAVRVIIQFLSYNRRKINHTDFNYSRALIEFDC